MLPREVTLAVNQQAMVGASDAETYAFSRP
jgi:hypothetical protein